VLVLTGSPANEGLAPITRALLEAMGKDPQLTGGATCSTRYGWPLLPPWLLALGITDVVVAEAQMLPAKVLEELIVLITGLGVRLFLSAHRPLGEYYPAVLEAWPTEDATAAELEALLNRPNAPAAVDPDPGMRSEFAAVPDSEFLFFRADCRDHLAAEDFLIVDGRYLRAAADMRNWLGGRTDPLHAEDVARMLRFELLDCSGPEEMLTVLRASAAVLLLAGVLVGCDAQAFRVAVESEGWYLASRGRDWSALAGYRQPYRAAVCAVTVAGLSLEQAAGITCEQVAEDGTRLALGNERTLSIPEEGGVYLRAQLLLRRADGAKASDKFFVTAEGEPASVRYLREALTEPTTEAGVELSVGRVSRRRATPMQWAARLGIRIRRFD